MGGGLWRCKGVRVKLAIHLYSGWEIVENWDKRLPGGAGFQLTTLMYAAWCHDFKASVTLF